jgi:hypothetical protein
LKEKLCDDIPDDFGYPVIPREGVEINVSEHLLGP